MTLALPSGATVEIYDDEAAWLAGRQAVEHQIGGSDVAALLGRVPEGWGRGPWTIWSRAQGLATHGFTGAEREDLDRGHRWELFILAQEYAPARRVTLHLHGRRAVVRHPTIPWATVSPDDIGQTNSGLFYVEAKTARKGEHEFAADGTVIESWDDDSHRAIPVHYALQGLWGLAITGLPHVDFVACIPQSGDWPEVRVIRLMAQPDLQAALLAEVTRLRDRYMVQGIRPDVDATDDCGFALRQLFPRPPAKVYTDADREAWALVERRAALSAQIKKIKTEYELLGNQIAAAVGDNYGIRLPGSDARALVIRMDGRQSVNLAALRKSHPDLLAELTQRGLITTSDPYSQVRLYGFGDDEE